MQYGVATLAAGRRVYAVQVATRPCGRAGHGAESRRGPDRGTRRGLPLRHGPQRRVPVRSLRTGAPRTGSLSASRHASVDRVPATDRETLQRALLAWFGDTDATCPGGGRATRTRSSSARSCCSRRRSRACWSATSRGSSAGRRPARSRRRPPPTSCAPGRASATTAARSTSRTPRGASSSSASSRATSRELERLPGDRPVHRARDRVLRVRRPGDGARHERAPRARALARDDRRGAAARAARGTGTRRSSTSARRSAWRASRAASAARWPSACPSRGRTFAPLRRQSRFEGSRRQQPRRARARARATGRAPTAATIATSSSRCSPTAWPCAAPTACSRSPRRYRTVSIPVYAANAVQLPRRQARRALPGARRRAVRRRRRAPLRCGARGRRGLRRVRRRAGLGAPAARLRTSRSRVARRRPTRSASGSCTSTTASSRAFRKPLYARAPRDRARASPSAGAWTARSSSTRWRPTTARCASSPRAWPSGSRAASACA